MGDTLPHGGVQCAHTDILLVKRDWYATCMVKLDQKLIFWSLAVHRYPKQPPRVIIFATMGQGMKLVIDGNFLAKKGEIWKKNSKPMLYTSKES